MNDRFSAQLRQHLIDTANERSAEGQLAAVVEQVAVTAQRPSLAARLTWNPGRIGPLPVAPLRFGFIAAGLVLAAVAGAILGGGTSSRPSTVFEGAWTSIDPGDGSGQTLVVGPGETPAVYFEDGYASGAACVNDKVKRFTARGTGVITDNRLVATFPDGGGCGLVTVGVPGDYEYQPASDTLVGQDGVVWSRALGGNQAATQAPATQAPATNAPESARPTPPLGDETFTSAIHGISLDYPSGWEVIPATQPWSGEANPFDSPDMLFDPAYDSRLILFIASQPYGERTPVEWLGRTRDEICSDGFGWGSWIVDGEDSTLFSCPNAEGVLISADERGYLIVFLDRDGGARTDSYDEHWFRAMLESVELRPDEAVDGSGQSTDGPGAATDIPTLPAELDASPQIQP